MKIFESHPICELGRDAPALIGRARQRQEPIVITRRGQDAAVLLPIELYRKLEREWAHRLMNPRPAHPADAERFEMTLTMVESSADRSFDNRGSN